MCTENSFRDKLSAQFSAHCPPKGVWSPIDEDHEVEKSPTCLMMHTRYDIYGIKPSSVVIGKSIDSDSLSSFAAQTKKESMIYDLDKLK